MYSWAIKVFGLHLYF